MYFFALLSYNIIRQIHCNTKMNICQIIFIGIIMIKRSSGILLHISSLFGDYGCGSFGENAKRFIDFLEKCCFSYWQVLPFSYPDEHFSPYKSPSAFSLNPYFIDLPTLFEEGLITKDELEDARQNTPYLVEFNRFEERLELLKKASKRFNLSELASFFNSHPRTMIFSKFIGEEFLFSQYIFFRQWQKIKKYANSKGIKIIGDIPMYISLNSSDINENPQLFMLDEKQEPTLVAGVPPDSFSSDGQKWGNPLYNIKEMSKDGFMWWRERIKFMFELFDAIRLDHFRAFESFYAIPTNKSAKDGIWLKGGGTNLINAIKEEAKDRLIIAENLGFITPEVDTLLLESGFADMRVLQFGFDSDFSSPHLPHNYTENSVAYSGTHDNNTLLGYLYELSCDKRNIICDYFGYKGQDWCELCDEIIRHIFMSKAGLVILPIQDIMKFGKDTRMNTPGKTDGNWGFRITEEQLSSIDTSKFKQLNALYSRAL